MASVITNLLRSGSLFLVFSSLFFSCTVRYFNHDVKKDILNISGSDIHKYLPAGFPDSFDTYVLQMHSTYYYKNNIQENILMTKFSKHTKRVSFFKKDEPALPDKFQKYEVWLSKRQPGKDTILTLGENAVMVSYKGKAEGGIEMYEKINVFLGKIESKTVFGRKNDTIMVFKPDYQLLYVGKSNCCTVNKCKRKARGASGISEKTENQSREKSIEEDTYCNENYHKIKRKKVKQQGKTQLNMSAVLSVKKVPIDTSKSPAVEIEAIINDNYSHFAAEKSMIFDLSQIYGEPVWLVKQDSTKLK